jgi:hypothetical protein
MSKIAKNFVIQSGDIFMKKLLSIFVLGLLTTSAFATTTLNCKSASFIIEVADIEEFSFANYGINGKMNDGADVEVGEQYLSDRIIALSLDVDEQERKFELSVTKTGNGKYAGQIFSGKSAEAATCTRK